MSMTDPIADMLTRIRNACGAKHRRVDMPVSKLKVEIAKILKENNFIQDYKTLDTENGRQLLRVVLKYAQGGQPVIHELSRTLVANMVEGVTKGFKKELELVGVGYKAEPRPYGLQLALGFSHPVKYEAPKGIKLSAPQPTSIIIEGANKEIVGQVAAELRSIRPPEPYKGKGIKYVGEQIRRKAGKAGKAGAK